MDKKRRHRSKIRSQVLTLRMTEEEMLRFKVAALSIGKKRAKIVRERVADLIGGSQCDMPQAAPAITAVKAVAIGWPTAIERASIEAGDTAQK